MTGTDLNALSVAALGEVGIDISSQRTQAVTPDLVRAAVALRLGLQP